MNALISDTSEFKVLDEDPTLLRQGQLQRFLLKLKKKGFFTNENYEKVYPRGSQPARMYGLPKLHKKFVVEEKMPHFRPINSSIGSYNYALAKFLSKMLDPYVSKKHSAKDTFSFLKNLSEQDKKGVFMVSYDVTSLYTNIPLNETISIAVDKIFEAQHSNIKISKDELRRLFQFATSGTHFQFNGKIYDQVDGVSMGNPLAPTLANLFMGYHEENWLRSNEAKNIFFYNRYVDDIFCLVKSEKEAEDFLAFLNTRHDNIKFTMEKEDNGKLPFLDISIEKLNEMFVTSVYKKPSDTGLLTNFSSFVSSTYKKCLIKTLVERIFCINNTWAGFSIDITKMETILQKNGYPAKYIEKEINKVITKKLKNEVKNNKDENCQYFKLPYIGNISDNAKNKLNDITKKFCKTGTLIKIAFTSHKISSYFSLKDKKLKELQSLVVYQFTCSGCNATYIGCTRRHLETRAHEHLNTDKESHIYKHVHSKNCKNKTHSRESFKIIDRANTFYTLKIKEAMHIQWQQPAINEQKITSVRLTLIV